MTVYHLGSAPSPVRYVRMGLDVGDARVGIALSDPDGLLATPLETAPRDTALERVHEVLVEHGVLRLYVGLPRSLRGEEGIAARKARDFIAELAEREPREGEPEYEVFFIDERFTTVSAHEALSASGRKMKNHRSVVDQVAAVMILQSALDFERSTGRAAGDAWLPPQS